MKLPFGRSRTTQVGVDSESSESLEPASEIAEAKVVATSAVTTQAIRWMLITCLVCAPVALGLSVVLMSTSTSSNAQQPGEVSGPSAGEQAIAEAHAVDVVVAWLTADRSNSSRLEGLVPPAIDISVAATGYTVGPAQVANIEFVDEVWSVTVGLTVTDMTGVTSHRYFQVPVQVANDTVTVLSLPMPVAGPSAGSPGKLEYRQSISPSSPLMSTLAEFLGAYLTGVGDVSRYVTPGEFIAAVTPAPYTEVQIRTASADDRDVDLDVDPSTGQSIRVLVSATASTTQSQHVDVEFALTLTARDGRWEVTSLDPAPAWSPNESASPTPSASSPASPPSPSPTPQEK